MSQRQRFKRLAQMCGYAETVITFVLALINLLQLHVFPGLNLGMIMIKLIVGFVKTMLK